MVNIWEVTFGIPKAVALDLQLRHLSVSVGENSIAAVYQQYLMKGGLRKLSWPVGRYRMTHTYSCTVDFARTVLRQTLAPALRPAINNHKGLQPHRTKRTAGMETYDFAQRLYLPRLLKDDVLFGAVKEGAAMLSPEFGFAYADDYDPVADTYTRLRFGAIFQPGQNPFGWLIKPEIAFPLIEIEQAPTAQPIPLKPPMVTSGPQPPLFDGEESSIGEPTGSTTNIRPAKRRFHVTSDLDKVDRGRRYTARRNRERIPIERLLHNYQSANAELKIP